MSGILPAVQKTATLRDALEEMRRRGLYHLLVLDGDEVVGVLSVVDAARALVEKLEAAGDVERVDAVRSFFEERVENVSTRPVIVVEEGVGLRDAARIMHSHRIGCLPVIRGDEVTGAICEPDVVKALAESGDRRPVYDHATRRVVYVEPGATLLEALGVMTEGGFRRLPLVERGAVVGVATVHTLLEPLLDDPSLLFHEVRRFARRPVFVDAWSPVSEAAGRILESGVGAVLLEVGGVLAGIFTERDAVRVYALGA